jgi:hypothetical protein
MTKTSQRKNESTGNQSRAKEEQGGHTDQEKKSQTAKFNVSSWATNGLVADTVEPTRLSHFGSLL